jgi:serine/threonine protein kinase
MEVPTQWHQSPDPPQHYRVIEKIGAGGMGEVYRAHDERLDRGVAIKVLRAGMLADEAARKRFPKEVLALAKLNHPNVAIILTVLGGLGMIRRLIGSKKRSSGSQPCWCTSSMDPRLDSLRSDSRFRELLHSMNSRRQSCPTRSSVSR